MASDRLRSVADLRGSFNAKTVKGRRYWYFQYTEPTGKLRQVYVGPHGESVQRLMTAKRECAATTATLEPLARAALALGCASVVPRQYRVLRRLADYGFFRAGAVLVSADAFLAYGNMLGVRWGSANRSTDSDVVSAGKPTTLALPSDFELKTEDAIESLNMGLLPEAGLSGRLAGSFLTSNEPELRLDFVTPMHRIRGTPFKHPKLGMTVEPLPFIEFSLELVEQAVLLSPEGAVLVNVPNPARFAVLALLVAGEGKGALHTKAAEGLGRAAALMQYLAERRPHEITEAFGDARSRGKLWASRLNAGIARFAKGCPGHVALTFL
jgi:hypothetical protein